MTEAYSNARSQICPVGRTVPFRVMPEAHRLRLVRWQLFATLTYSEDRSPRTRQTVLFSWLRDVAKVSRLHFKHHLLWVARYEFGRRTLRGHHHICIAALRNGAEHSLSHCRRYEELWRARTGAIAAITPYNPDRDGVGYALKRPYADGGSGDQMECEPTLSHSLMHAMRRGRL